MPKKYQKLLDRRKECIKLYKKTNNDNYLREDDSILHVLGAGGIENYEFIVDFCTKNNITFVYDIGAAYGHQSEMFLQNNEDIIYVGVEAQANELRNFWNNDKYTYIQGKYPCELNPKGNDLAISVLCLGWNCYLYEGEKTINEQFKALSKDFEHALIFAPHETKEIAEKYFKEVSFLKSKEEIGTFIYMTN
jgi:hypothetical protein